MTEIFSWPFAAEILPALLHGAVVTFIATIGGFLAALLIGAVLLALVRSKWVAIAWLGRGLVELL